MLIPFAGSLLAYEIGYRLGFFRAQKNAQKAAGSGDSMLAPILGLLAFILAFTFSLSAHRFDEKRQAVLEEANSLRTVYLRAGYLEEPHKSTIRSLLKDYTQIRIELTQTGKVQEGLQETETIQKKLWEQVVQVVKQHEAAVFGLVVSSMNDVFNIHAKRVLLHLGMRIPGQIWLVLFLITFISMGSMGYLTGLKQTRNMIISLAAIFSFSLVMMLITDLDHAYGGFLQVTNQPLKDVLDLLSN